MQSSRVQTYLTKKITNYFSERYGAEVTIEKVDIAFFNKLYLKNVYIEDLNSDTFLHINTVQASVSWYNLMDRQFHLYQVVLDQSNINLLEDSTETLNLEYLLKQFESGAEKSEGEPWNIGVKNVLLRNSKFSYKAFYPDTVSSGMNFSDIKIWDLNLDVDNIQLKDTITFTIENFTFKEQSGFHLKQFRAKNAFSSRHIHFDSLRIHTNESLLEGERLYFDFDSFPDFGDFINKINMDVALIDSSHLHTDDLAYFVPDIKGLGVDVRLNGEVNGTVNNLQSSELKIRYGDTTYIMAQFSVSGLPDIDNTSLYLYIDTLRTFSQDIESIKLPPFDKEKYLSLPSNLQNLGVINFMGKFEGLFTNFYADGVIRTNLGLLSANAIMRPDTVTNQLDFRGQVATRDFNLGHLLGNQDIGKLTFITELNGYKTKNNAVFAELEGDIESLMAMGYNYQHIKMGGNWENKVFDGTVSIDDPNIKFDINGLFDFSSDTLDMDFNAQLEKARLDRLKIDEKRQNSTLAFRIDADFKGHNVDNLTGELNLKNAKYQYEAHQIIMDKLSLSSIINEKQRRIELNSDFADAQIKGNFETSTLMLAFNNFIYHYLPSFITDGVLEEIPPQKTAPFADFRFEFNLKDIKPLTQTFLPSVYIKENAYLKGFFNSENYNLNVDSYSPFISFGGTKIKDLSLNTESKDSILKLKMHIKEFFINDSSKIDSIVFVNRLKSDTIHSSVVWDNREELDYSGDIRFHTIFLSHPQAQIPSMLLDIERSYISIADTLWTLHESRLRKDTTTFIVNNFLISNKQQKLRIHGKVSENKNDSISVYLKNLRLSNLDMFTAEYGFYFKGMINGSAHIFNLYEQPVVYTTDSVADLMINDEIIGDLFVSSQYRDISKMIEIEVYNRTGKINSFTVDGKINPSTDTLNLELSFNRFRFNFIEPLIEDYISNLNRGYINGNLLVSGTTAKPMVNGEIEFFRNSFTVNYLNTTYNFAQTRDNDKSNVISFINNDMYFENFRLNSSKGQGYALVNGNIKSNNFTAINFDLNIDAKNFLFLDTDAQNEEMYYGTALASGIINVTGDPENIQMKAAVTSRPGTRFFIPLNTSAEASETKFVTFVQSDTSQITLDEEYEVDLSGIEMQLDLEVTPDAEVQIIFDEQVGDIIKANGEGTMNMEITPTGEFNMFGDYTIQEGEYHFTLQNIVNKKFSVTKGSSLNWTGDPVNANIDLTAVYSIKKVPLYDLMLDEEFKEVNVPVNTKLNITGKLMNPLINFQIELPDEDISQEIKTQIKNLPDDNVNKQFLSLLVINRFQPLPGYRSQMQEVSLNTSELLSNQLSHMLSQISNDFDIGVNYRPGDEITNDELEVALTTQLWNDRVTINGNVGVGGGMNSQTEGSSSIFNNDVASNLVGDFDVNIKITESGKFRVKAFTEANDNNLLEDDPYTYGVGIFYREDFNSFKELFENRKKNRAERKKKRKSKKKPELPEEQPAERKEDE